MDKNTQLALAENWNFARNFPSLDGCVVDRPNFLETIYDILTDDNPIVFLEGDEGDGATTTLAQFSRKYPDKTFSLFIKPASKFAYSIDYLRLTLAEQFHWYVYGTSYEKSFVDAGEYETLIHSVRKKIKATKIYFVIDGLHQIPDEDSRMVEQIIRDVLPCGIDKFHFVISGQQADFSRYFSSLRSKPYQQLKFRPEDTEYYLHDLPISKHEVLEIHKLCKAVPGRIAAVKRLLVTGKTLQEILEKEPSKYLEFIRLEFNIIDGMDESSQLLLAVVTFSKQPLSLLEIRDLLSVDVNFIQSILDRCQFITKNEITSVIEYISESHRKCAEKILDRLQSRAFSLQIDYLLTKPSSEEALRYLPSYYQSLNRTQAIVELISTDHYSQLLRATQSTAYLKNRAEIGMRSARQLDSTADTLKFSVDRSIFVSLSVQAALESEVSALVGLNQPKKALILANQVVVKEDRLSLLATYAKQVKEKDQNIDPELVEFIRALAEQIDFSELGDRAVEIAADILFIDADLAVSIIEQATKRSKKASEIDNAFAHLSITASLSKIPNKSPVEDKARQKISDAALQKLTTSFSTLVESLSPAEVIQTVEQMDSAAHRIYFLKWYIQFRRKHEHILDVVEYALDAIIKETTYTPKSRDFAELSIPLPYAGMDKGRLERLIQRFETQVGLVEKVTFSKDIIILQLRIAHAEMSFDRTRAAERIEQAYFDVAAINTPEVRSECYAIMLRMLKAIDSEAHLENEHGFRSVIRSDLGLVLNSILEHTADHYDVIAGSLKALAEDDEISAYELASKLNTELRRDEAYSAIVKVLARLSFTESRRSIFDSSLDNIVDESIKAETLRDFLRALKGTREKSIWRKAAQKYIHTLSVHEIACECLIFSLALAEPAEANVEEFNELFLDSIRRVDSKFAAVDLYYRASAALSTFNSDEALRFYESGSELKLQMNPDSPGTLQLLSLGLLLFARASQPVMKAGQFKDDSLARFFTLVDQISCSATRVEIYADFSARAWCARREDISRKVIFEKCVPLLDDIKDINVHAYQSLAKVIFPVMRGLHSPSALALLAGVSREIADDALYNAAIFIIRKSPPKDPVFSDEFDKFKLERKDGFDLMDILEKTNSDAGFYWTLAAISSAITSRLNKVVFTAQQKAEYVRRIREMISEKLPDPRNIRHDGYKIAALAQALRIEEGSHANWMDLERDALLIPNIADRGYTLLAITGCMPSKYEAHKKRMREAALALFDQIPSPIDRLSHYQGYANAVSKDAVASARETLKRALLLSAEIDASSKVDRHRRELIDIADRIDPSLAEDLIEVIDDDPARAHAKAELKRSAAISRTKREIANAKFIKDVSDCDPELMPVAAWKNLGALLVGRLETKPVRIMRDYVMSSSGNHIATAYPVLCWFIENSGRKFIGQDEIAEVLSPQAEALLKSAEMTLTILRLTSRQKQSVSETALPENSGYGLIVKPKDRAHAIQYIRDWLRQNAVDYIKLCDPYFGPDDLHFLRLVLAECPSCSVRVLTSMKQLKKINALSGEVFLDVWKSMIDQDPPDTEILAVGGASDEKNLLHDRWILSSGRGLRMGTSFNSLGDGKLSEISVMEPTQATICEHYLDQFFERKRMIEGLKISYTSFTL